MLLSCTSNKQQLILFEKREARRLSCDRDYQQCQLLMMRLFVSLVRGKIAHSLTPCHHGVKQPIHLNLNAFDDRLPQFSFTIYSVLSQLLPIFPLFSPLWKNQSVPIVCTSPVKKKSWFTPIISRHGGELKQSNGKSPSFILFLRFLYDGVRKLEGSTSPWIIRKEPIK
jgi:hypothetical protein